VTTVKQCVRAVMEVRIGVHRSIMQVQYVGLQMIQIMFAYSCFSSVSTCMNVSVLLSVLSAVVANKRVHIGSSDVHDLSIPIFELSVKQEVQQHGLTVADVDVNMLT